MTLCETSTQPTVTFDFASHTINLSVITTPASPPGTFIMATAPVSVPLGTWTMFWDLVPEGAPAVFKSVDLPTDPLASGNVMISGSQPSGDQGIQWTAVIDNRVHDFNGFSYNIFVAPPSVLEPVSKHDPSIAVTPDPPPGG